MTSRSLARRLLYASVAILPLFLGLTALILEEAFRASQASAKEVQLRAHSYLLMGVAEWSGGTVWMPDALPEPRLNQLGSGLYAYISHNGQLLWRSASAVLQQPPASMAEPVEPGQPRFEERDGTAGQLVRYEQVLWETSGGATVPLLFIVAESRALLDAELRSFRVTLWRWLGGLGVLLALLLVGLLRWGLRPLHQLAQDLHAIEQGEAAQLEGVYPEELQPVADNLNQLIQSERQQRERFRNSLGDLAHSLKTPLAVLRSALDDQVPRDALQAEVRGQVERMDQIVRYQLQRAVTRAPLPLAQAVPLPRVVERLQGALGKVYHDRAIDWQLRMIEPCAFAGDEQDLFELLGNLLDNACKYGRHRVALTARQQEDGTLRIEVEDDGDGVPDALHGAILKRGERADTAQQGQGIGLAVVVDILSSYGGSLTIRRSRLGGACFALELPGG